MRSLCLIVPLLVVLVCSPAFGGDAERSRKVKVALALAVADAPKAVAKSDDARAAKVAAALKAAGIPSPPPFVPVPTVAPAPMPREVIAEPAAPAAPNVACFAPGECPCSGGCKCADGSKCPGCCPTKATGSEISYAAAIAAVARGEHVVVFYRVSPHPVPGKWAYSDAVPDTGPGRYEPHPQVRGKVRLVTPPVVYYAERAARPVAVAPAFGPVCVGSV